MEACPLHSSVWKFLIHVWQNFLITWSIRKWYFDGLVQERCNSCALAIELVFLALTHQYIDGSVQDFSNCIANAL